MSRSFNGAALFRARRFVQAHEQRAGTFASTGPRSFERGGQVPNRPMSPKIKLQRGRALSSAEVKIGPDDEPLNVLLQRGRALSSAEVQGGSRAQLAVLRASTGPRSFERGGGNFKGFAPVVVLLQRGRALSSAEVQMGGTETVNHKRLQRGRALSSAEVSGFQIV